MSMNERIAAALTAPLSAAEADALRQEVATELTALRAGLAMAEAASLDPLAPAAEAHRQSVLAAEFAFAVDRLDSGDRALADRVDRLRDEERRQARAIEHDTARAERDVLAADIAAHYPRIVATMLGLLDRLAASNARLAAVNAAGGIDRPRPLASAEDLARGRLAYGDRSLLTDVAVPAPTNYSWPAWPRSTTPTGREIGEIRAAIDAMLPGREDAGDQDALIGKTG